MTKNKIKNCFYGKDISSSYAKYVRFEFDQLSSYFVILVDSKGRTNKTWKNEIITKKGSKFKKLSDLVHLFDLLRNKKTCIWIPDPLGKK